jgi:hypothetical protein
MVKDLITNILKYNEQDRMSLKQLIEHEIMWDL